uniref:Uncharacterized protein n=1 Tax=Fagus sylvatica TaxID=28930 RepID=A0A2N9FGQ3_FAGSY
MMGETSGPSAQDIRMASFEEKFNDLLNFVRLLVKRDTESEKQVEDINKDTSEDNTGGHSHTNSGPPLVQPSKPKEGDFQLDVKVEKTMGSTKMNDPSPKGNWNTLEGPQSLQMYGNGEENVMNKKEDDHSDIRSLQGQPLYPSNQGDTIEPHSDRIVHALKNKVQDLVDHGILRINEGSTPSVIIAWPPERRKDETVIPSPQSQGPTTCGIQPVHLTTLPTLSEVGEHTVPKTQPKLMSNFRNLDDQCSSDKEKAEYCTNRCVTLKRKIQELGHSELEVPTMVQARKPSMHTVPMKKARSTLGFRANEPSRDQTERTISRSTGAWIPHRQG